MTCPRMPSRSALMRGTSKTSDTISSEAVPTMLLNLAIPVMPLNLIVRGFRIPLGNVSQARALYISRIISELRCAVYVGKEGVLRIPKLFAILVP